MISFSELGHKYQSLLPDGIDWISVSTLCGQFKQPFDPIAASIKCSKKKTSKWYGMKPEEIQWVWKKKADKSCVTGTWYHNVQEQEVLSQPFIEIYDTELPVVHPIFKDDVKLAPEQQLTDGIYPEHFCYLKTEGVCGQSDKVIVHKDTLYVGDYKTNEELTTESYFNQYTGQHQMMLPPVQHLQDCKFENYSLQLSTYAYMIQRQNPQLINVVLEIEHVIFEYDGEDEWGYPIIKLNEKGEPIVADVKLYPVEYRKTEVKNMFAWLRENRNNLRKKS